jgi:tetratricopeptide (TPR) repeat protein
VTPAVTPTSDDRRRRWPVLCWSLLLLAAVAAVYSRVASFEFVHYDDLPYLLEGSPVRQGLTRGTIAWAFREPVMFNWHPLTMLSYLLDAELWGMSPAAFHLVNVALHGANTLALFLLLRRLTGYEARSAVVAALFALHPLHVESVAWVAERKDVLSTLFLLLTIGAYASAVARPSLARRAGVALLFALGLMAKAMLVTLPFVLLLVDFWPLGRFAPPGAGARAQLARLRALALEKAPLFALAAAACVVTYVVQQQAMERLEHLSPAERLANAALSYLRYLAMTVWPVRLGVFYPMPTRIDLVQGALASALLVAGSTAVLRWAQRAPWLFTGWFWYVGTLVPVIGIVQVGGQSHADRYTYVPLIGIFVAAVWAAAEAVRGRPAAQRLAAVAGAAGLALLSVQTWLQLAHWRNTETLYERALSVAPENPIMHYNLATLFREQARFSDAALHYREAARLEPELMPAWAGLALSLSEQGQLDEAWRVLAEIAPRAADSPEVRSARAVVALARGDLALAEREASEALRLDPRFGRARDVLRRVDAERRSRAESAPPR